MKSFFSSRLYHRKCYANIDRKTVLMFSLLGTKNQWSGNGWKTVFMFIYFPGSSVFLSLPYFYHNQLSVVCAFVTRIFYFFVSSISYEFHFSLFSVMFVDVYPSTHSYCQLWGNGLFSVQLKWVKQPLSPLKS